MFTRWIWHVKWVTSSLKGPHHNHAHIALIHLPFMHYHQTFFVSVLNCSRIRLKEDACVHSIKPSWIVYLPLRHVKMVHIIAFWKTIEVWGLRVKAHTFPCAQTCLMVMNNPNGINSLVSVDDSHQSHKYMHVQFKL